MIKIKDYEEIQLLIGSIFSKMGIKLYRVFGLLVLGILKSENCQLPEIATAISSYNGKDMNTNLKRIERFLQNKTIEVEDRLRRCYINMCFSILIERGYLEKGQHIPINVDFTSKKDCFLILSASMPFFGRYVPLYFTMRVYPKKKGDIDQKKMELAFLKGLKHLLPTGYKYVIVADRGFGNTRFMKDCSNVGFEYIIRINENRNIDINGDITNIKKLNKENSDLINIILKTSGVKTRLITKFKDMSKGWYILTSIKDGHMEDISTQYGKRFRIEKMFQDEKSSGFKIEDSKIRYYDRFKRLLFSVYVAQALTVFVGEFVENNGEDSIKKKYPMYLNLISVFSNYDKELLENSLTNE